MPDDKPREMTVEECRQAFLRHLLAIARSCAEESRRQTTYDKITLAIFSVLAAIDGESIALPGFRLIPGPHPDDRAYRRRNGENWWPVAPRAIQREIDDLDISDGELHSRWARMTTSSGT